MSDIKKVIRNGLKFYNKLREDENGRYRSWEYCYKVFNDAHKLNDVDDETLDYLSLQLSFYLASWGMYRGSSFLLQKDYKVHKPVIQKLLNHKYDTLWGIKANNYNIVANQNKLMELVDEIRKIYNDIRSSVKYDNPKSDVSDTLITKVLMGTLGCVPAYDRYFITGVRNEKVSSGCFNIKSILGLADFYNDYHDEFEKARNQMYVYNMKYPQMKMIDSCFWQIGYDLDEGNSGKTPH